MNRRPSARTVMPAVRVLAELLRKGGGAFSKADDDRTTFAPDEA